MAVQTGSDALRSFNKSLEARVTDWMDARPRSRAWRDDRGSSEAFTHFLRLLEATGSTIVHERYSGEVLVPSITLGVDESIEGDDEVYLYVGNRGVDVLSVSVSEASPGVILLCDRWGDDMGLSLTAEVRFD
jgi:hypothetical protein